MIDVDLCGVGRRALCEGERTVRSVYCGVTRAHSLFNKFAEAYGVTVVACRLDLAELARRAPAETRGNSRRGRRACPDRHLASAVQLCSGP